MRQTVMEVRVEYLELSLRNPFRIGHGSSESRHSALICLGDNYGESALPPYYPTTLEDVETYVRSLDFEELTRAPVSAIPARIRNLPPGPSTARAGVDMLLYDIWAKSMDQPLYSLFGLDPSSIPGSMYSLSIPTSLENHIQTVTALPDIPMLKLKIGSGDIEYDEAIVHTTREYFSGRLCADANSQWSIPEAIGILPKLNAYGLEFVEQPIPAEEIDDWHLLKRMTTGHIPPLIADESVRTAEDVLCLAGAANGVNLKLSKCGGIAETLDLIRLARSLDMTVMLGCMIESSLALTAAAHIAALADFVDLDATTHLARDPFRGMAFNEGIITLSDSPGLGVHRID